MPVLSLSDFLWSLLIIFFMVTYFMMLFHVIVDVFRRHDTSGVTKAIWLLVLLILPLFGLLIYLIVNGQGMNARDGRCSSRRPIDPLTCARCPAARPPNRGGQAAARQRRHRPGGVRPAEGQGARRLTTRARPQSSTASAGSTRASRSARSRTRRS